MKMKIITLPFNQEEEEFTDLKVQTFLVNKNLVNFVEHFFFCGEQPYITFIISYRDREEKPFSQKPDFKNELSKDEYRLYELLKNWRNALAQKEGKPNFTYFNNKQLLEIVKNKPTNKTDLQKISGIGSAKSENYGEELNRIVLEFLEEKTKNESESD